MVSPRVSLPLLLILGACAADPAGQAPTEEAKQAAPSEQAPPAEAPPADPNQLTQEEIALIEADPATLNAEQRRKRGYALRKKVMQNPDSEAAKALEEARQAAIAGEIDVPGQPKDNGVVIPAPDYLKNPDQSYGKPAE